MSELTKETAVKEALEKEFGAALSNFKIQRVRRMWADVAAAKAKPVAQHLKDKLGFAHLATITGVDSGENFEALYHMAGPDGVFTLRAVIPASGPELPTVTDLFPGAENYERELEDMFGIKVSGLKPGNRYPLQDDWPAGQYPLRKSWKQSAGSYPKEGGECQK